MTKKQRRQLRRQATSKRAELIRRYGRVCCYCACGICENEPDGSPVKLTVEHVLPISRGGKSNIENLRLACLLCNVGRGNGLPSPDPRPRASLALTPRVDAIEASLALEDEQGRRELRIARATQLGVRDERYRPGAKRRAKPWSLADERTLRQQIAMR